MHVRAHTHTDPKLTYSYTVILKFESDFQVSRNKKNCIFGKTWLSRNAFNLLLFFFNAKHNKHF